MSNLVYFIKSHHVLCIVIIVILPILVISLPLLLPKLPNQVTINHHESNNQAISTPHILTTDNIPIISQYEIDKLSETIYQTARLNGVKSNTDVIVRKNSIRQTYNEKTFTYVTDFIVDLPSVKQSYRVHDEYYMVPHRYSNDYALLVTCPHPEDLIYPSFKCTDRIRQEGGTE